MRGHISGMQKLPIDDVRAKVVADHFWLQNIYFFFFQVCLVLSQGVLYFLPNSFCSKRFHLILMLSRQPNVLRLLQQEFFPFGFISIFCQLDTGQHGTAKVWINLMNNLPPGEHLTFAPKCPEPVLSLQQLKSYIFCPKLVLLMPPKVKTICLITLKCSHVFRFIS